MPARQEDEDELPTLEGGEHVFSDEERISISDPFRRQDLQEIVGENRAGCTLFKGRALVIGREKGRSLWRRGWRFVVCRRRRIGFGNGRRFQRRLPERALH